jgi:hypothetical protein
MCMKNPSGTKRAVVYTAVKKIKHKGFTLHCSEYFVDWPKIRENISSMVPECCRHVLQTVQFFFPRFECTHK